MKVVTFFSRVQGNVIRCFARLMWKGSWFLVAFCAVAAYASAGDYVQGEIDHPQKMEWNHDWEFSL